MGTPINRCVGTKQVMDPEPEFRPIGRPSPAPDEAQEQDEAAEET